MTKLAGYEQAPRYGELVDRLLGEDIEFVPPGLIMEIDRPEWLYLGRTTMGAGSVNATSAAGTLAEALLLNPSTDTLIIVTRIRFNLLTAAAQVFIRRLDQGTPPAGFLDSVTAPRDFRDSRLAAGRATVGRVMSAAVAAADGGIGFLERRESTVGREQVEDEPFIIAPLSGLLLTVGGVGVNQLVVNFYWRERGLRSEEKAR